MMSPEVPLRLGVRGRIRRGPDAGKEILVDSVGMTPVDALVVILSPDLDEPGHPDERVSWINPEEISAAMTRLGVVWTGVADDQADRFL